MIAWAAVIAIVISFVISTLAAGMAGRLAVKFNMLDSPGGHKSHGRPVPLLGGSAIFAGLLLPSMLAASVARVWAVQGVPAWVPAELAVHAAGASSRSFQAVVILGGAFVLHVVGLIDDRKALGPWLKLVVQVAVALAVALIAEVRVLTAIGGALSVIATVFWLVLIINAFNFLDNMDGLAVGVAVICAAALAGAAMTVGQVFVSAWLCLLIGAMLGFLPYNFPPARMFMGDAGSMVIGFMLGVMSCLTTYVRGGQTYYLYGIFVPLVVMAVPIYDMAGVIMLRIRARTSPMVGDRRHFSHRLVRRGMNPKMAVLTIYACTAATAIGATILPRLGHVGAILVFVQTATILLIVALLESGGSKP